jgi:prophage antirepressor-like protein
MTHTIRTITLDGNPWFDARGVCDALGMSLYSGTSQWLVGLSQDEKRLVWRREVPEIFSGSRAASVNFISESGLYKVVLRSDKPEAREFQDWVTRVVLPAIRKDGAYIQGEEKVVTGELSEDEFVLKALTILQGKVERLRAENVKLTVENTVL